MGFSTSARLWIRLGPISLKLPVPSLEDDVLKKWITVLAIGAAIPASAGEFWISNEKDNTFINDNLNAVYSHRPR